MLWRNVRFEEDGSGYELSFDKRKNAQYRKGNKELVASSPLSAVCPVRLLRELHIYTDGSEDLYIFRGFIGRLVAKSPRTTAPGPKKITYDKFLRFMSLWLSGDMEYRWQRFGSSLPPSPAGAEVLPWRPMAASRRSYGDNMGT